MGWGGAGRGVGGAQCEGKGPEDGGALSSRRLAAHAGTLRPACVWAHAVGEVTKGDANQRRRGGWWGGLQAAGRQAGCRQRRTAAAGAAPVLPSCCCSTGRKGFEPGRQWRAAQAVTHRWRRAGRGWAAQHREEGQAHWVSISPTGQHSQGSGHATTSSGCLLRSGRSKCIPTAGRLSRRWRRGGRGRGHRLGGRRGRGGGQGRGGGHRLGGRRRRRGLRAGRERRLRHGFLQTDASGGRPWGGCGARSRCLHVRAQPGGQGGEGGVWGGGASGTGLTALVGGAGLHSGNTPPKGQSAGRGGAARSTGRQASVGADGQGVQRASRRPEAGPGRLPPGRPRQGGREHGRSGS